MHTLRDIQVALKVSTIMRSFGRARTEVWGATDWNGFKAIPHSLPTQ